MIIISEGVYKLVISTTALTFVRGNYMFFSGTVRRYPDFSIRNFVFPDSKISPSSHNVFMESGFKNIRIRCRIRRMFLGGSRIPRRSKPKQHTQAQ